jgi:hypothetical protein
MARVTGPKASVNYPLLFCSESVSYCSCLLGSALIVACSCGGNVCPPRQLLGYLSRSHSKTVSLVVVVTEFERGLLHYCLSLPTLYVPSKSTNKESTLIHIHLIYQDVFNLTAATSFHQCF